MNKKENPGVSRRGAAMLLLFSLVVSVLLGFAMPVHAADGGRTTLRTLRVGFLHRLHGHRCRRQPQRLRL